MVEPEIISSDSKKQPMVIFEDDQILVLDKPAGMVVNRATSVKAETVQDWIARNFQFPISNFQLLRNGIVHRLDKETSGLLLVAKTPEAFQDLQRQFKERKVKKTYLALVHGRVIPEEGIIRAPVGRLPWNRERFGVLAGGREAETRYKVISNFKFQISNDQFSLLELYPQTGRTHQIRVHLKYFSHPIFGDPLYAGRKRSRTDRKILPRLFLHASKVSFTHPKTGKQISFESLLPSELETVLRSPALNYLDI